MVSMKRPSSSLLPITRDAGCKWSVCSQHRLLELLGYILLFKLPVLFLLFAYTLICEHDYNSPKNDQRKKVSTTVFLVEKEIYGKSDAPKRVKNYMSPFLLILKYTVKT